MLWFGDFRLVLMAAPWRQRKPRDATPQLVARAGGRARPIWYRLMSGERRAV